MGYEARQENIESFNEDEDVRIFLLSTRAGGLVSLLVL
jgi:SNF2 family DNA or RNA helicase